MKNFIFFTDSHLRLTATRRRTDNMFEAQLTKLKWIGQRASELKSEFIVCGGDLGDSWDWKISMVNKVADVLKQYKVPVYTIIGNHDVPGRNPELWKDTGLGLLNQMSVLNVLENTFNDGTFLLMPFHSDSKKTDDLINGKVISIPVGPSAKVSIAVAHAPIGAETTPFCRGHKELFINQFDIALFGDIHDGWPVYNSITGCKICNPGSLTRLSKKDMYRKPQIAIIYEDGSVMYEEIPHVDTEDCFDTSGIEAEKQELGKGFLAAIAARQLVGDINPKEYIEKIGLAAGYSVTAIETLKNEL